MSVNGDRYKSDVNWIRDSAARMESDRSSRAAQKALEYQKPGDQLAALNDQYAGRSGKIPSISNGPVGLDMSAYAPGQAQPKQTQSQGTPYQNKASWVDERARWLTQQGLDSRVAPREAERVYDRAQEMNAPATPVPGRARYPMDGGGDFMLTPNPSLFGFGTTPQLLPPPAPITPGSYPAPPGSGLHPSINPGFWTGGNFPQAPSQSGPTPGYPTGGNFPQAPGNFSTPQFAGSVSGNGQFSQFNDPGQLLQAQANALAQRDAVVQQMNQALMPYQYANYTNQNFGAPQFDLQGMRQKASEMVQDGFYNPFTRYFAQQDMMQQLGQYAPPSMYDPGGLGDDIVRLPPKGDFWPTYYDPRGPAGFGNDMVRLPTPNAPDRVRLPTPNAPEYGGRIDAPPGTAFNTRWQDSDSDGIDDRDQRGPGMPFERRPDPPSGGRYLPTPSQPDRSGFNLEQSRNAQNFIRQLEQTNPNAWSDAQWADYKQAQRDTGIATEGGYSRQSDGSVRYQSNAVGADGKMVNYLVSPNAPNPYGVGGGSGGGQFAPPSFPSSRPGQAQPIQAQSLGTQYDPAANQTRLPQVPGASGPRYTVDPTLGDAGFGKWKSANSIPQATKYDRVANEQLFDRYLKETGTTDYNYAISPTSYNADYAKWEKSRYPKSFGVDVARREQERRWGEYLKETGAKDTAAELYPRLLPDDKRAASAALDSSDGGWSWSNPGSTPYDPYGIPRWMTIPEQIERQNNLADFESRRAGRDLPDFSLYDVPDWARIAQQVAITSPPPAGVKPIDLNSFFEGKINSDPSVVARQKERRAFGWFDKPGDRVMSGTAGLQGAKAAGARGALDLYNRGEIGNGKVWQPKADDPSWEAALGKDVLKRLAGGGGSSGPSAPIPDRAGGAIADKGQRDTYLQTGQKLKEDYLNGRISESEWVARQAALAAANGLSVPEQFNGYRLTRPSAPSGKWSASRM